MEKKERLDKLILDLKIKLNSAQNLMNRIKCGVEELELLSETMTNLENTDFTIAKAQIRNERTDMLIRMQTSLNLCLQIENEISILVSEMLNED